MPSQMLSVFACTARDAALHGPNSRLLPVLDAKGVLPVSVLAPYTKHHGSLADDSQAHRHTTRHTTLV